MIENLDVVYSAGNQSLFFDAPEGCIDTVVTSEVFLNHCKGEDTPIGAVLGMPTISTDKTTFSALSGDGEKDARIANLTSSSGFLVGRRYVAVDSGGEPEWVEAREIHPNFIVVRLPMRNSYVAGDTFSCTRLEQPLMTAFTDEACNISDLCHVNPKYRWRIEYIINGKTYVHAVYFDLVRYRRNYSATILDVDTTFPGFADSLPTRFREGAHSLMEEAYRQVKIDMHASGKADQMHRNREIVDDLVIHKAALLGVHARLYSGAPIDPVAVEMATDRYNERFNLFVNHAMASFDKDDNGGADAPRKGVFWVR